MMIGWALTFLLIGLAGALLAIGAAAWLAQVGLVPFVVLCAGTRAVGLRPRRPAA